MRTPRTRTQMSGKFSCLNSLASIMKLLNIANPNGMRCQVMHHLLLLKHLKESPLSRAQHRIFIFKRCLSIRLFDIQRLKIRRQPLQLLKRRLPTDLLVLKCRLRLCFSFKNQQLLLLLLFSFIHQFICFHESIWNLHIWISFITAISFIALPSLVQHVMHFIKQTELFIDCFGLALDADGELLRVLRSLFDYVFV